MRSAIFAAAFATTALAANTARAAKCMSDSQAQHVADNFRTLIADYSDDLADKTMTTDFTDYSAGVNTLINSGCTGPQDLNGPTFSSLEEFKAGQGSQPAIPFEQLNIWHTCDTVIIRWRSEGPGQEPEPVTGNIVIEATPNKPRKAKSEPWLIQTVYSEFNSGAWLVNLGVFEPTCPAPPPPGVKRSIGI
ncbi:uncharacterized protein LTR77_010325 [Saxophila tyrrhenica]|uniref:NTF2-like domain-containing protein n=1 Tax=Saxophila tyrrhenica TaxID=1690608 RepID=A0AAV9NVQ1_9PEZI|nr:hypothetical protein LTR77_010325 [Saxophila tyrrhenica]